MRIRLIALVAAILLLLGGIAAQAEQSATISDAEASTIAYEMLVGLADPANYFGKTDPNSQLILAYFHHTGVHSFGDVYVSRMEAMGLTPYTEANLPPIPGSAPRLGDSSIRLSLLFAAAGVALCGVAYAHKRYARL